MEQETQVSNIIEAKFLKRGEVNKWRGVHSVLDACQYDAPEQNEVFDFNNHVGDPQSSSAPLLSSFCLQHICTLTLYTYFENLY